MKRHMYNIGPELEKKLSDWVNKQPIKTQKIHVIRAALDDFLEASFFKKK